MNQGGADSLDSSIRRTDDCSMHSWHLKLVLGRLAFALVALMASGCGGSDTAEESLTAATCRADIACEMYGDCGLTAAGRCGPTSTADCENAVEVCGDRGLCSFSGGDCVATSDAVCTASRNCKRYGACHISATGKYCAATTREDCDNSDICRATYECMLNVGLGTCENHGGH
jgi:hypothetical protein